MNNVEIEVNGVFYDRDDYERLCDQADYWGMDSLTEDEQVVLATYSRNSSAKCDKA